MYKKFFSLKTVFIISLGIIFILASVALARLSVNVYDTVSMGSSRQELSRAWEYFSQEIRQSDGDTIRTASIGGNIPALVIESYQEGVYYETWFFTYDGNLKKVKIEKGKAVSVVLGEPMMPLAHTDFSIIQENLLEISLTSTDDIAYTINFYIQNREGGVQ